jgi:hypothetical protein
LRTLTLLGQPIEGGLLDKLQWHHNSLKGNAVMPGPELSTDETETDIAPKKVGNEALDHAWNWFKYHADQRIAMVRFYIVALGGAAAGIGILFQHEQHFLCTCLSLFTALMSFSFLRIDQRTSDLVKIGENALRSEQSQLAVITGNQAFNMCRQADAKGTVRLYTYGEVFRLLLSSAMAMFLLMALFSLITSKHMLMLIHSLRVLPG